MCEYFIKIILYTLFGKTEEENGMKINFFWSCENESVRRLQKKTYFYRNFRCKKCANFHRKMIFDCEKNNGKYEDRFAGKRERCAIIQTYCRRDIFFSYIKKKIFN